MKRTIRKSREDTKMTETIQKQTVSENINKFVIYRRTSTNSQDLGLNAQTTIIQNYLNSLDSYEIIGDFEEQVSGKNDQRVELDKAIKLSKSSNSILLLAKLDRLSRRLHFISGLMESGVNFRVAESPGDNRFILHVKACVSEEEARKISERTSQALQELKRKGIELGTPNNDLGVENRIRCQAFNEKIKEVIEKLNCSEPSYIAFKLNEMKVYNFRNQPWNTRSIRALMKRVGLLKSGSQFEGDLSEILRLRNEGWSINQIAIQLGYPYSSSLYKFLKRKSIA